MKIRSQIALLVGGVAVPLIVLATIVTAVLIQRERAAVESGLRDTVRALSLALDRELVNTTATLRAVAASVASERGDVRVFRDEAVRVFESQQPDWVTLLVVDPSGRIIIDARGPMSSEGGPDQWIDLHPGETRGPVIGGPASKLRVLSQMRAGVFRPGGPVAAVGRPRTLRGSRAGAIQGPAGGIVAAQALRAAPDGVLAGEMPPHQDTQPRATAPARAAWRAARRGPRSSRHCRARRAAPRPRRAGGRGRRPRRRARTHWRDRPAGG